MRRIGSWPYRPTPRCLRKTPECLPGEVTVIIPARNNERTVKGVVYQAKASALVGDVIVVDNDSADRTAYKARQAGARVIRCKEIGKAEAVRAGLRAIRGTPKIIVFLDADIIFHYEDDVDCMIRYLDWNDNLDMVCGIIHRTYTLNDFIFWLSPGWRFSWRVGVYFKPLTGERAIRYDVLRKIDLSRATGYELEAVLNCAIPRKRICRIPLMDATQTRREQGAGLRGFILWFKRVRTLVAYVRFRLNRHKLINTT